MIISTSNSLPLTPLHLNTSLFLFNNPLNPISAAYLLGSHPLGHGPPIKKKVTLPPLVTSHQLSIGLHLVVGPQDTLSSVLEFYCLCAHVEQASTAHVSLRPVQRQQRAFCGTPPSPPALSRFISFPPLLCSLSLRGVAEGCRCPTHGRKLQLLIVSSLNC